MYSNIAIVIVLYKSLLPKYIYKMGDIDLIIVDNTPERVLQDIPTHVKYIPLLANTGIAHALNVGMSHAIEMGKTWVLTMDQDSIIPDNMLSEYSRMISKIQEDVAILSPQINMYQGESKLADNSIVQINEALTSGSLLRTSTYKYVGGFKDELFIDEVDFDYCWNIRKNGFQILQVNSIVMQHQLGDTKEYKLFGRHLFYVMNESPLRHYYMQRNQLYVRNIYKEFFTELEPNLLGSLISLLKVVFFEKKCIRKLYARYLGYRDYKKGIFGECKHKNLI